VPSPATGKTPSIVDDKYRTGRILATPKEGRRMIAEPETFRFVHLFSRTLLAELSIRDQPPPAGQVVKDLQIVWTGRPKKNVVAEYRAWTLSVYQALADRWQRPIAYALGISPSKTELWECRPGSPPHLLRILNCGI
jgi:hypothetical protein